MITKILFTALIVIAVMVFMRHKNSRHLQQEAVEAQQAADRKSAMLMAIGLVSLTLAISAGIYYWHWTEAHRIAVVEVINSHTGKKQSYHVYQSDIDGRQFRTVEGRLISLSDTERMEVREDVGENE